MSIIEKLIEVIKSNFYSIFTFVSVSVFIVFVYSYFIAEKTYISDSKLFVYGESSSVSELKSLALEYGVSLPGSGGQQANFSSPELFVNLTKSKTVLKSLANQSFSLTNGDSKSLKEHLLKKSLSSIFSNKEREMDEGDLLIALNKKVSISLDRRSGIITLSTAMKDPLLAQVTNESLIDLVNTRFTDIKRLQTKHKRQFVESRISELDLELMESERKIKEFKELNRSIKTSPQLTLELNILKRDNKVVEEVFILLKEQLESMKLKEVEDEKPLIIIDSPNLPHRKSAPITSVNMIYTFILSLCFSIYYYAVIRNSIDN
tara:strand:+ start:35 stop:991 length:957 start_codon:yes stop_codon:yes gene_type:complete